MTELAFHETGSRGQPTIVFLHGVGNTAAMWDKLAAALPDYHCLAPDLPGHGASRALRWQSRSDTARRIAALIEARATSGRAHVVGLSLGGSVALELLTTRPDLLNRVIVDGCGALPSAVTGPMKLGVAAISPFLRFGVVARAIGRTFGISAGPGLDEFVAQIQSVDAGSFRRAFAHANETRITNALLAAPCPTLLVAGERELRHVRQSNRVLAERMPAAEARMVLGVGHGWGPVQLPDAHRRMVKAWLKGTPLPPELHVETIGLPARDGLPVTNSANGTTAGRGRSG
jgi:pimeloyl-ACP methyl ester carboxylesterase